jgi:hypothetical protein
MNSLKQVITKYSIGQTKHLGKESQLTEQQYEGLRQDLQKISDRNGVIFWVILIAVLLLFVLSIVFVALNQDNPDKIKVVFGITGVSVMGLIYYLIKIWKEKNYIDMTLVMVKTLDQDMVNAMLLALVNKV